MIIVYSADLITVNYFQPPIFSEVVSCAEEMRSADDERTLFFNSPTDPADLVLKSSSSKSPCSDHDQHDSQDRCTTLVRGNAAPVQSSLSRSGDDVNDNLATLTRLL